MSQCRSCEAEIRWVVLPTGKRMPIDPEPHQAGGVVLDGCADMNGEQAAHFLLPNEARTGGDRYRSHFATCPQASAWRKG